MSYGEYYSAFALPDHSWPSGGPRILVVGIGNVLLADDGVGVHAMRVLQDDGRMPPDVEYLDAGTMNFAVSEAIEACDHLMVLDAANLSYDGKEAAVGDVGLFEDAAMDRFLSTNRRPSVHEIGLLDLMKCALLAGRLPNRRAFIGIQPQFIGWGDRPTPLVEKSIDVVCDRAVDPVQRLRL